MAAEGAADRLMAELLEIWSGREIPFPDAPALHVPAFMDVPTATPVTPASLSSLGAELGERLVAEVLDGVKARRQGILISEPDRVRTAIFVRGLSLGEFARRAGLAPSTLFAGTCWPADRARLLAVADHYAAPAVVASPKITVPLGCEE